MTNLAEVAPVLDEDNSSPFRARRSSSTSRSRPPGTSPTAIRQLVEGVEDGLSFQTLLGVTGSGKTFTMANVIARMGRPAIVFAPNKTLGGPAVLGIPRVLPAATRSSTSSATTTTTSRRPMCRSATCSSRRTRRSTSTSSRCGCRATKSAAGAARHDYRGDRVGDLRYR